ncbi:alginate lyase family protein [Bacteroides sp.]|uniref:alginate lyase family protein n=1 Tax=Bacteroides sp. TaxID=29523 RepID=UPI002585B0D3|nr:alginate lyase family protein [Bacteroides sp.]
MILILLIHTIRHLQLRQVVYQIYYRLYIPRYSSSFKLKKVFGCIDANPFIYKYKCCNKGYFKFLNIDSIFSSWSDVLYGSLWSYNLNYMDWLQQEDLSFEEGAMWINKFIEDIPNNSVGLDPYPIALRGINWIKFISTHYNEISKSQLEKWNNSLYSQYKLLENKIEYHLLGNHLLEDAYSLFIASLYFRDASFYKKYKVLLKEELNEQILPDGAHFEQSPMYHCILLERLLDSYNISIHNQIFDSQIEFSSFLKSKAIKMLGHLESILYADKSFPLFNDSARGIAPSPLDLFLYAKRLNLIWQPIKLKECGYRKMSNSFMEAFVDIGNITAPYQPGHTHSDVFNYELRVENRPFIVDTGVSTYNKTERRQYERSSCAHNTVSIDEANVYDVWSGFRVARRAKVDVFDDCHNFIRAKHDGFQKTHKCIHLRTFYLDDNNFIIIDFINSKKTAISYIHLASDIHILSFSEAKIETNLSTISIDGADKIEIIDDYISLEYNKLLPSKTIKIHFCSELKYTIS